MINITGKQLNITKCKNSDKLKRKEINWQWWKFKLGIKLNAKFKIFYLGVKHLIGINLTIDPHYRQAPHCNKMRNSIKRNKINTDWEKSYLFSHKILKLYPGICLKSQDFEFSTASLIIKYLKRTSEKYRLLQINLNTSRVHRASKLHFAKHLFQISMHKL